uniref:Arf-GAP domain-containing protein n=1 Tax=Malurus cyaneus samueli TaxID=2593467 RepID=A0A8C5UAA8_9PASS
SGSPNAILFFSFLLPDPDWASHSLGIFICLNCSGIHRSIPQVSKVKSVRLDDWDDAQVEVGVTKNSTTH